MYFSISASYLFLSSHQTIASRDEWDFLQLVFWGFFLQRRCNCYNVFSEFCDEFIHKRYLCFLSSILNGRKINHTQALPFPCSNKRCKNTWFNHDL